jgi:hypothetical protein
MTDKKMFWKGLRKPLAEENLVIMSTDGEIWANLPLYLDEVNHSPTGFEWGYRGSGPAQLAYAILRSYFEIMVGLSPELAAIKAQKEYFEFKDAVVCNYFGRSWSWELDSDQIRNWRIGRGI